MTTQVPSKQVEQKPEKPSMLTMSDGTFQGAAEDLVVESNLYLAGEAALQAAGEANAVLASEASAGLIGHGLHLLGSALTHVIAHVM